MRKVELLKCYLFVVVYLVDWNIVLWWRMD